MSTETWRTLKEPLIKGYDDNWNKVQTFLKNEKWQDGYRSPQICEMSHLSVGTTLKDKEQTMKSENLWSKQRAVISKRQGKVIDEMEEC